MKARPVFLAISLALGLTAVLLLALAWPAAFIRASPSLYYVQQGAGGDCLSATTPCSRVQRALNLAVGHGGEVWVAAGAYTENLVITRGLSLRGGWDAAFTVQSPVTCPTIVDGGGESVISATVEAGSALIEGFILRNGQDGVHVRAGTVTVERCTVRDVAQQGFEIGGGTVLISDTQILTSQHGVHVWTGTVTVERCTVRDVVEQGIQVDGGTVRISATQILSAQQGIKVDDGVVEVARTHIAHTSEDGLLIESGGAVSFTASTIEDGAQRGVWVNGGRLWLFDNLIRRTQADGVRVEGGVASIVSNTVRAAQATGIAVGCNGMLLSGTQLISGNLVYAAAERGIYAHDGVFDLINNTVYDTGDDGIRADGSVTVTIGGNTVYSAGNDGVDVQGASAIVAGNVVYDTQNRGISAEAEVVSVTDNTVHDADGDGIHTAGSSMWVEVRGNAVYGSGDDGIDVRGDVISTVRNRVKGCADTGIQAEGDESVRVEANWVLGNAIGIAISDAPLFTMTNNVIGDHVTTSVELAGVGVGRVYHNTLVGSGVGRQGTGLAVLGPLTAVVVNNVVVSHSVGITAAAGAALEVGHTLLWGNGDDSISGTLAFPVPPMFAAPAQQDYHLLADAPAVDAGIDVGVLSDVDGDPRPVGIRADIGADEVAVYHVYLPFVVRNWPPPPSPPVLPVYRLYASPQDLDWLSQDPYRDETIPATFCAPSEGEGGGEGCWEVDVRYRGDTARKMPKKSWKVFFPGSDLFQGQEELNLNADYVDQTLLRSYLGYDLLARAGVPTPRAGYARLTINDEYYGLFSQAEQIDERFLHRMGIEMHGNLYKPFYGNLGVLDHIEDPYKRAWWYNYRYPKKTNRESGNEDIVAFIELINYTPDEQFQEVIAEVLDVNGWLDWYAVNVLIGNFEMTSKNYYLYHDFSTDRWMILPWDVDISFGHNEGNPYGLFDRDISWDNPIDTGADPAGKYNNLIDRMMDVPEFRFYHCRRLTELMADEFSPAEMFPRIDGAFAFIYDAVLEDPNRWRPDLDGDPGFEDGPDELKTYITNRIQFLEGEMPGFCPDLEVPLTINEFMADNASTVTDEAGENDGWIEIHNGSSTLAWDLGGMYLTDVLSRPNKWRIPDGTLIPPGGTLLVWADGEGREGPLHASFELSSTGGQIGLFDRDAFSNAAVSVLTYTLQATDVSYGRMPDGGETWQFLCSPTPGWSNKGRPPVVGGTTRAPVWPTSGADVTVTTAVTDAGSVTVTLWYRAFAPGREPPDYESTPMTAAAHETGGGGLFVGTIPGQADGTWVEYYLEAEDEAGMVTADRPGWPQGDYRYVVGWQRPPLSINELMAINTHTLEDEAGESDDWIELYNAGPVDIDVGGMYLSDNIGDPTKFQLPAGTVISAGSTLILWADGDGVGNHLNFKLSGAGEYVGLFDSQARYYAPIDAVYFDPQTPDVSRGRFPDGGSEWHAMAIPTPGRANRLTPPQFSWVTRIPTWPGEGQRATLTTAVTVGDHSIGPDGLAEVSLTLWYDVGSGFQAVPMAKQGSVYIAQIPPQPEGALVSYYLEAVDSRGQSALHLPAAPTVTHRYLVGYEPPAVLINEFLADNVSVNRDEAGEYDDWVELHNGSAVTVTLDGMYLTDDLGEPKKWQFPPGTIISPGGYLLVWCDGDPEQGALHAGFRLDRDGEEIGLFGDDAHGNVLLDHVVFGPQQGDVSYGRRPGRVDTWEFLDPPTPGMNNDG